MAFEHNMIRHTQGIAVTAPVRWRMFDGIVADYWQAEGEVGGQGYYLSPDPRIVLFLDDIGEDIRMADRPCAMGQSDQPMGRAVYVPANKPLWTRFSATRAIRHLDLHLHEGALSRMLSAACGPAVAAKAIAAPVSVHTIPHIAPLGDLLAAEVSMPAQHPLYAQNLVQAIATAMMVPPEAVARADTTTLSDAQMRRLCRLVDDNLEQRRTNSELAAELGLSQSWFSHMFKATTGQTPLQWQNARRVARAKDMLRGGNESLSELAALLGFADQAHMTRVFRSVSGSTPGAWRRAHAVA
ncbi:helix-turn-helix transcriptional regulator [Rhodobacteraceae bacterium]|nr:helix-turn-helix transcriptional regulator [Paracoccaceae bacterium]